MSRHPSVRRPFVRRLVHSARTLAQSRPRCLDETHGSFANALHRHLYPGGRPRPVRVLGDASPSGGRRVVALLTRMALPRQRSAPSAISRGWMQIRSNLARTRFVETSIRAREGGVSVD